MAARTQKASTNLAVEKAPVDSPQAHRGLRLEGQVVDENLGPVGDAEVHILGGPQRAHSERDGSFAFTDLEPGRFDVFAAKGDLVSDEVEVAFDGRNEPLTLHMHAGATVKARVIESMGGAPIAGAVVKDQQGRQEVTDVEGMATLRGVGPRIASLTASAMDHASSTESFLVGTKTDVTFKLSRGAIVSGKVLDSDEQLVSNANVYISRAALTIKLSADSNGHWVTEPLGAGKYSIVADSDRFGEAAPVTIELDGEHPRSDVTIHVSPGGQVVGTVVDAAGQPTTAATVTMTSDTRNWHVDVGTDSKGEFRTTATPGAFHVWAHDGPLASPLVAVRVTRDAPAEVKLKLEDASLAGTVVDTHREPVAEAKVLALPTSVHGVMHTANTDSRGHFDFGALPKGSYNVSAHRSDEVFESEPEKGKLFASGQHDITLVVPRETGIKGRVVLDHKPVTAFGIVVSRKGDELQWRQTFSNPLAAPDGRFLKRGIEPGERTLVVFGQGFARKMLDVDVPDGRIVDVGDINVDHGQRVRGHVMDTSGVPVPGASVTLFQDAPVRLLDPDPFMRSLQGGAVTTTDASGAYLLDGISPAVGTRSNRIGATHPDKGVAPSRDIGAADSVVDLVLVGTGAIDGRVTGSAAGDYEYAWAGLASHAGELQSTNISHDRSFKFEKLAMGDYSVWIARQNSDGFSPAPIVATVSVGKTTAVSISATDSVTVRVHVTGRQCQAVFVFAGEGGTASSTPVARSFCDGGYANIKNVPPDSYHACVDEHHCASFKALAAPAVQELELRVSP